MEPFKAAHAASDNWAEAVSICAEALTPVPAGANLGFVYVTDLLADDFPRIVDDLRRRTGVESWVGSVALGVCSATAEYFDRAAVAAMVASLPPDGFRTFPAIAETTDEMAADSRAWIAGTAPPFGIVHGDPYNPRTPDLVEDLAELGAGFLVGGLTSSRYARHQVAGGVTEGGLSGVLFAPGVEVATTLSQGCTPIGPDHLVTECVDNVLITLDGVPALDVFKQDVGDLLARDLNRAAGFIHAALPVEGSDTGDYMVRNLIGIDPTRGWLAIGAPVETGSRVLFVRRDSNSAGDDLEATLGRLKQRLSWTPRGGVYFSCVARGAHMFGAPGREVSMIRDVLGDIPLVGFYAGGEISNGRLYGYTGVLALFA